MSMPVFTMVMLAAMLHALWNTIAKRATNGLLTSILIAASASALAVLILPFLPLPHLASWPYLLVSTCLQISYFVMLAHTYRAANMSLAYPLMRGTPPLLVAIVSTVVQGVSLGLTAWMGILVISFGIFSMVLTAPGGRDKRGVLFAMVNALIIACYTLIDGVGVRLSGAPVAYTVWLSFLSGIPLLIWGLATQPRVFVSYLSGSWPLGLFGGFGSMASYGIALWAMTRAPVAIVAALRETSILFATAFSYWLLRENMGKGRLLAVCAIVAGVMVLRLA